MREVVAVVVVGVVVVVLRRRRSLFCVPRSAFRVLRSAFRILLSHYLLLFPITCYMEVSKKTTKNHNLKPIKIARGDCATRDAFEFSTLVPATEWRIVVLGCAMSSRN